VKTFKIVTITHKTANINHIGRYIPSVNADPEGLVSVLKDVKVALEVDELLYLATCNRLTFFLVTDNALDDNFLLKLFEMLHPTVDDGSLSDVLDVVATYEGAAALEHLFEVASSLDSLVIGEREILRQLKASYEFCHQHKLTGDNIRLAIKMAIPTAKEVYTLTKIGENSVSVVSLAMREMLKHHISKDARFLIVGAGQTNNLVAKFLLKQSFKNFAIFNRSLENAKLLAAKLNGQAYTLNQLHDYHQPFDVLITCTGANDPVITEDLYKHLIGDDTSKKIIVDLAVPSDVVPTISQNFNVDYIEVERLRCLAAQNLKLRGKEVIGAKTIIAERLEEFKLLFSQRRVERAMSEIPAKLRAVKNDALNTVFQEELSTLDEHATHMLQRVLAYIEKKYIGIPITVAKSVFSSEFPPSNVVQTEKAIKARLEQLECIIARTRRVERAILEMPCKLRAVKRKALHSVFQKDLASMDDTSKAVLERVLAHIEKQYIHIPMLVARTVLEKEYLERKRN